MLNGTATLKRLPAVFIRHPSTDKRQLSTCQSAPQIKMPFAGTGEKTLRSMAAEYETVGSAVGAGMPCGGNSHDTSCVPQRFPPRVGGYVIYALFLFRLDSFQKSHGRNRHLREKHKVLNTCSIVLQRSTMYSSSQMLPEYLTRLPRWLVSLSLVMPKLSRSPQALEILMYST